MSTADIKGVRTVIQTSLQFLFTVGRKTPRLQHFVLKLEGKAPVLYLVEMLSALQVPGAFPRPDVSLKCFKTRHVCENRSTCGSRSEK